MFIFLKNVDRQRLKLYWLLLLSFSGVIVVRAQTTLNDCSGAIEVCGNGAISSNAIGTGQQEIFTNACSSMEHNSLWIKIEVTKAGTLGFTLTPTSSNLVIDYDFFVFGPDASCGNLGTAVRCSTTNPQAAGQATNLTGMNDQESDISEGPGPDGNSFIKSLDVLPGQTYYIVIDRPIGQSPFDLEWTGTSTLNGSPFPEGVEVHQPNDLVACGIDGAAEFDLFETREEINNQPQTQITYFANLEDAVDQSNELPQLYTSNKASQTIYARVENLLTGCSEIVNFKLVISEAPDIPAAVTYELCDLDSNGLGIFDLLSQQEEIFNGLQPANHNLSFYADPEDAQNGQNPISSRINSGGGTFYVRVEEKSGSGCFSISEVNLQLNEPIALPGITSESLNLKIASKEITVPVQPEIEYAVNSPTGPYSSGPQLPEVPAGMNTLYIRNAGRCEITSIDVLVPEFAAVFSPNNDGVNDSWFVSTGTYPVDERPVRIFDRYGKLLGQFYVNAGNWDGTLNGRELPADDYWFEFSLPENLIIKGHFSLLR